MEQSFIVKFIFCVLSFALGYYGSALWFKHIADPFYRLFFADKERPVLQSLFSFTLLCLFVWTLYLCASGFILAYNLFSSMR